MPGISEFADNYNVAVRGEGYFVHRSAQAGAHGVPRRSISARRVVGVGVAVGISKSASYKQLAVRK